MACSSLGASTTLVAGVCSSSSMNGQKLAITSARPVSVRAPSRVGAVTAKYGEKSVYFDLGDISNTTGKWDLYGNDEPNRYNGLQSKFFETFGGVFSKRGLLLKFLVLGWATSIGYFGSTAAGDLLPIKKGPQQAPVIGPRDRI
jgi:photosystem I subunit 6